MNMTQEQIYDRVADVVCKQLALERQAVKPEASFTADLGADSLDTVELLMSLEEAFSIKIPDGDAEQLATIKGAVDYIQARLTQPN